MQKQIRKTRRWSDGEQSSGGPAGAATQPHAEAATPVPLSIDDARAVHDYYLRGAATRFVVVRAQGPTQLRRMREAGLIEILADVRNKQTVKLTPRGLAAVLHAAQMLSQATAIAPAP